MSDIGRLDIKDVFKGALTAMLSASVLVLYTLTIQEGFSISTIDWASLADKELSVAAAAFLGYLIKNFFTDADGKVLGMG